LNDELVNSRLEVRDKILDLSSPQIMGVLNATPDSFSDGGEFNEMEAALGQIGLMISQGASVIDVGGESTRPGSMFISAQEERERVMPVLEKAIQQFPDALFSIDTTKYDVAEEALRLGVHFVNDISGLRQEPRLVSLCARYNAGYILMHSQGNPKTMQDNPVYDDVVGDIKSFFEEKTLRAKQAGVQSIIIDPGIGFGKTLGHNIELIKDLEAFKDLGYPLMIGAPRKRMIGQLLNDRPVTDRLTGTVAVHYHAMLKGVDMIRVHDVRETNDSLIVYNALKG
jgi:dihydropteroate synthase